MPNPLKRLAHTTLTPACRFACFALLLLALAAAKAAEPEMLTNGEMEGPFVNRLAQGWMANCYGSNEVVFAQQSAYWVWKEYFDLPLQE